MAEELYTRNSGNDLYLILWMYIYAITSYSGVGAFATTELQNYIYSICYVCQSIQM
jgi:hypothetical protein